MFSVPSGGGQNEDSLLKGVILAFKVYFFQQFFNRPERKSQCSFAGIICLAQRARAPVTELHRVNK